MANPPKYTCASCRWYWTEMCHRFPPSVTLHVTQAPDAPDGVVVRKLVAFPFVEPHWACAEHQPAAGAWTSQIWGSEACAEDEEAAP
jgi:hypothetical protein